MDPAEMPDVVVKTQQVRTITITCVAGGQVQRMLDQYAGFVRDEVVAIWRDTFHRTDAVAFWGVDKNSQWIRVTLIKPEE